MGQHVNTLVFSTYIIYLLLPPSSVCHLTLFLHSSDANRLTIADKSNNPVSDIPATLLNELGAELAQEAFPVLQ